VRTWLLLSETEKPPEWRLFLFYSISSEYHIERINRPNIFEGIVVEVVWNEGSLLRFGGAPLDNFSTFRGLGDFQEFWAGRRGFGCAVAVCKAMVAGSGGKSGRFAQSRV
jgi:hypothetical protein